VRDGIHPRKNGLTGPVRVPNPVNAQPQLLQHVFSIGSAAHLAGEKLKELRTEQID